MFHGDSLAQNLASGFPEYHRTDGSDQGRPNRYARVVGRAGSGPKMCPASHPGIAPFRAKTLPTTPPAADRVPGNGRKMVFRALWTPDGVSVFLEIEQVERQSAPSSVWSRDVAAKK